MSEFELNNQNNEEIEENKEIEINEPETTEEAETTEEVEINEEKETSKEEAPKIERDNSYSYGSSIEFGPSSEEKGKNKNGKKAIAAICLVFCFLAAVAVAAFAGYYFGGGFTVIDPSGNYDDIYVPTATTTVVQQNVPKAPETTVVMPQYETPADASVEGSYVYVNEKAAPSVVSIVTEAISYNPFYGNYVDSGAGSGVIIANSGDYYYIITNNHVVDGFSNIMVYTVNSNSEEGYTATVMGTDWTNDIAIIRIETKEKLNVAELATSDSVVAGQSVAAIGNPLGMFSGTITPGIISSVTRKVEIEGVKMELLQHSASVSPGNSGGGLFNMKGQLIGIVNAKSSGEGVEGIGFAIPIDTAIRVADDIINKGYATGIPYLGISYNSNMYISSYAYNHELAASGQKTIAENDILVAINGKSISTSADIRSILSDAEIGGKVTLKLMRIVQTNGYKYTYENYEVEVIVHEYIPTVE